MAISWKKKIKKYLKRKTRSGFCYDIYLAFYRLWHNWLKEIPREIRYKLQKMFRGYSDRDLWGLSDPLGLHIVKLLKAFRRTRRSGVPSCFCFKKNAKDFGSEESQVPDKIASARWEQTLKDMISGFEFLVYSDSRMDKVKEYCQKNRIEDYFKEYNRQYDKAVRNAKKFVTYFNALWD